LILAISYRAQDAKWLSLSAPLTTYSKYSTESDKLFSFFRAFALKKYAFNKACGGYAVDSAIVANSVKSFKAFYDCFSCKYSKPRFIKA
jgi:hypothetical protein